MNITNEDIYREVVFLKEILTGNGDPAKGLIVRVDRLEQSDSKRSGWAMLVGGAAVTSLVATAWSHLTGK